MSINKLVLKGTGKMSLHERFTQLKFDQKSLVQQQTQPVLRPASRTPPQRATQSSIRSYDYSPPRRARTPDLPRYNAKREASPVPVRQSRSPAVKNRSVPNRNPYGTRSSTMLAANRVRKKSVYLRLGVRPGSAPKLGARPASAPRMSSGIPVWTESFTSRQGWGGRSSGMSRSNSTNSLNRWNSQGSLNSFETPRYMNNRSYGGWNRGGRRNTFNYSYNNRGGGRGRFRQGRFGGRGRFQGRGNGFNRGRKPPPPKKEDLDLELDNYMAGTRGILDQDLDSYMANKS